MRGRSLNQRVDETGAHPSTDVKKLSKHSDNAADHAQMKSVSESVWKSFEDVRQSPSGLPKYSSWKRRSTIDRKIGQVQCAA